MPPQPKEIQIVDHEHHKLDVNSDGSINTKVLSSSSDSLYSIIVGDDPYDNRVQHDFNQRGEAVALTSNEYKIQTAEAFRVEDFNCIDADEYIDYYVVTPSVPQQIHVRVKIFSTAETNYNVFLEPTITDNGTQLPGRSKNPHYQFIGVSSDATYLVYKDPTYSSSGPNIRTQKWGYGAKQGGSSDPKEFTIQSPVQKLLFRITSRMNGNCINFEIHWDEYNQPDPEVP